MRSPFSAARACVLILAGVLLTACATDSIDGRRQGQQVVCHDGVKTLAVSTADHFVHLDHGDQPGPCPDDGA